MYRPTYEPPEGVTFLDDVLLLEVTQRDVECGGVSRLTDAEKSRLYALMKNLHTIYFVHAPLTNLIKIGVTQDMKGRLATLQTGSPEKLEIVAKVRYDKNMEKRAHKLYKPHKRHGEWFDAAPLWDDISAINSEGARAAVRIYGDALQRDIDRMRVPPLDEYELLHHHMETRGCMLR